MSATLSHGTKPGVCAVELSVIPWRLTISTGCGRAILRPK